MGLCRQKEGFLIWARWEGIEAGSQLLYHVLAIEKTHASFCVDRIEEGPKWAYLDRKQQKGQWGFAQQW